MKNNMKISFLLLISFTLAACGLAAPTDPLELDPDETAPIVTKITPLNNGILGYSDTRITLTLDEAIAPASLERLNVLQIETSANVLIPGVWSFSDEKKELTFTLDDRDSVPQEQRFTINFDGEVTDVAGNPLVLAKPLQYSTPKLFSLRIRAIGLLSDDSVTVTQRISGGAGEAIVINKNNQYFSGSKLQVDDTYKLSVTKQSAKSFCSLTETAGPAANLDITLKCHDMMPVYSEASDWNQYTAGFVHGGELRRVTLPNLSSCDDLSATDGLAAFDWVCSENLSGDISFTSTGLKATKNLSDLIDFNASPPGWKSNSLTVKNVETVVYQTNDGIWWNNPVLVATIAALSRNGAIYLIQDSLFSLAIKIKTYGIALLINPAITFSPSSNDAAVLVSGAYYTWVEGNIRPGGGGVGVKIENSTLSVLRNVKVEKSFRDGINVDTTRKTVIYNSQSIGNAGHGIYLVNSSSAKINKIYSSNNEGSGIYIASPGITLSNVNSLHNIENGIVIAGSNNTLADIMASNNRQDGLVLAGALNNIINTAIVTSNDGSGVRFSQTANGNNNPGNNVLSNMTIGKNLSSGVLFEMSTLHGNRLINILEAYNEVSTCLETSCDDVTEVVSSDILIDDLFSPVTSEVSVESYTNQPFFRIISKNNLENKYRAWGAGGEAAGNAGTCNDAETVRCMLFDWSLNAANEVYALSQFNLTESLSINTHELFRGSETLSFLSNAVEIMNDNVGNDNSLCETDEACIFTPNVGGYQGHGDLIPLGLDGENELNATLFIYSENGR